MNRNVCQLVGCENECYYDKLTGSFHNYCCWTHANIARDNHKKNTNGEKPENLNFDISAYLKDLTFEQELEVVKAISQIDEQEMQESNETRKTKICPNPGTASKHCVDNDLIPYKDEKKMNKKICKLAGCESECYYDKQTGRWHDYCRWTHANLDKDNHKRIIDSSKQNKHEKQNLDVDITSPNIKVLTFDEELEIAIALSQRIEKEKKESNEIPNKKIKTISPSNSSDHYFKSVYSINSKSSCDNMNQTGSNITSTHFGYNADNNINAYDNTTYNNINNDMFFNHEEEQQYDDDNRDVFEDEDEDEVEDIAVSDTDRELLLAIKLSLQLQHEVKNLPQPPQQSLHHHNTTSEHDIEYDMAMAKSLQEQEEIDLENEMVSKLANIQQVWTCEACTLENIDLDDKNICSFCGIARSQSLEWSCSRCLFDNAASDDQCSICGSYNPYTNNIPPSAYKNNISNHNNSYQINNNTNNVSNNNSIYYNSTSSYTNNDNNNNNTIMRYFTTNNTTTNTNNNNLNTIGDIKPPQMFAQRSSNSNNNIRTTCGIPGCSRVSSPRCFGFCTESHYEMAQMKRLLAPSCPHVQSVFIGDTGEFTAHLLMNTHRKYNMIKKHFLNNWLHTTEPIPRVQRIYWIRVSPLIFEKYNTASKAIGNVQKLFHGTAQSPECYFGKNPSKSPCSDVACRVCSICRESFSMSKIGSNAGRTFNLRYGNGLYFSPVSSKSHSYNSETRKTQENIRREFRNMFLCNVAVGHSYETLKGLMPAEQCPPDGYDSITGLAGQDLNYPEVCIYNKDYVIPSFLIVYSIPMP